jgi:excisionase family DNA binding protein
MKYLAVIKPKLTSGISEEWLTTKEAAAYLKVSEGTLRNLCCNGVVPYYKLVRRNRYRVFDLRSLLMGNQKGGVYGL